MVTTGFIIVHIYYKHVMRIIDHRWFRMLNYIARCAGFTSAYGLIVVGSFQVTKMSSSLNIYCCCSVEQNGMVCTPLFWGSVGIWCGLILLLCCHGDQLAYGSDQRREDVTNNSTSVHVLLSNWWNYHM